MGTRSRILLALLLVVVLSGCGTLNDTLGHRRQRERGEEVSFSKVEGGKVRIYGGLRYDLEVLYEAQAGWLLLYFALDVPLSAAVDTVLLPFTVPYNLMR